MLSSRWPLWTRSASKALPACRACHAGTQEPPKTWAPLPATFGLLFTLAGAPEITFLGVSVRVQVHVRKGPRVNVRLGFRVCAIWWKLELEREKVDSLEAPLPVSPDEASKASRLKALRWQGNQCGQYWKIGRRLQ